MRHTLALLALVVVVGGPTLVLADPPPLDMSVAVVAPVVAPTLASVPVSAPMSSAEFWIAIAALACGILSAIVHRVAASRFLQRPWGLLLTGAVGAALAAVGSSVAAVGLTRGLVLVALSAVASVLGAYSPAGPPSLGAGPRRLDMNNHIGPLLCLCLCLVGLCVGGCTPAQTAAWSRLGKVDMAACASKATPGAISTAATALVADLERTAAADPSAWDSSRWTTTGTSLAMTYGVDLALCILSAAWAELGPVVFADLPTTDPRVAVTWLLAHPEAWRPGPAVMR